MGRALYILFVLFEAVFFNIALPGHERGMTTVAGYVPGATSTRSCCASDRPGPRGPDQKPSSSDKAHCALCYFIVGLCIPPAPVDVPALWQASWSRFVPPVALDDLGPARLTYLGRAPPVALFISDFV